MCKDMVVEDFNHICCFLKKHIHFYDHDLMFFLLCIISSILFVLVSHCLLEEYIFFTFIDLSASPEGLEVLKYLKVHERNELALKSIINNTK